MGFINNARKVDNFNTKIYDKLIIMPRPANLWVTDEPTARIDSGSDGVSCRSNRPSAAVLENHCASRVLRIRGRHRGEAVGRSLPKRSIVVQVADDCASQSPQVVHVLTNGFGVIDPKQPTAQ